MVSVLTPAEILIAAQRRVIAGQHVGAYHGESGAEAASPRSMVVLVA
jgi:hypothetical protein